MKRRIEASNSEYALSQFLLEKKAQGLTEATISGYTKELSQFIAQAPNLQDLNQKYVFKVIDDLSTHMKPVSVNHFLRIYRSFLYWCMENNYIEPFKIKMLKTQESPIRLYDLEDINTLLERPSRKDNFSVWRTWALISFVMGTGARIGTLINIKLEDINLSDRTVVYTHSKNKHAPIVPLCDNLVKVLNTYINEFSLDNYLFPSDDNTQLSVNANKMAFQRYCNKRGVEYNSFHALRHTFSKQFIVNGGNPFQLQKMLDHQSLAMSEHYTHLFATDLKDVVNDFSPLSKIKDKEKITRKSWQLNTRIV